MVEESGICKITFKQNEIAKTQFENEEHKKKMKLKIFKSVKELKVKLLFFLNILNQYFFFFLPSTILEPNSPHNLAFFSFLKPMEGTFKAHPMYRDVVAV